MNINLINGAETSVETVSLAPVASVDKMDGSTTHISDISPVAPAPIESTSVPLKMNITITATLEEDESSLSSSGTDRFDRSSANSSSRGGEWHGGVNGSFLRYGATESATGTGVSSMCSSVAAEDKPIKSPVSLTPAKKRMSDGSIKIPTIRLTARNEKSPIQIDEHASTHQISDLQTESQTPPKKRRGRPPKDRSLENVSAMPRVLGASAISTLQNEVRPRSSIPSRLPVQLFASQCMEAAYASRLDPFALHPGEHQLLANLLMSKEVTIYLNIRNAMLRLWSQNPLCSITPQEAAGCAKDGRFFGLAEVAYKWLIRNGYINFGCVEVPQASKPKTKNAKQKTVVVIGAGVSGLTTARQLEHLFAQGSETWTEIGERPPRVVLLEGRSRIGGRVYSKPLRSQVPGSLPDELRNTAEMGAMIVTGFEHGNPLDTVIRGQLGLRYHLMTDTLTIYDCNGKAVNDKRDMMNTDLYTDISDRTGQFRAITSRDETLRGDEDLVKRCRDPAPSGLEDFQLEPLFDPLNNIKKQSFKRGRRRNAPPGTEKLTGRSQVIEEIGTTMNAARSAKEMGWQLREGVSRTQNVSLRNIANASKYPTLGSVMDNAIEQFQALMHMTPQDMRLLNWHHANLEYANAAPVSSLSLSGHDQDTGNEFEGKHSEIIGGYTQLPRGLMNVPTKLDVKFERVVESIHYDDGESGNSSITKVVCTDGEIIEADQVVITTPLGVLKSDMVDFDPPLPRWKQSAIKRMGFGLLNKVILLYDKPFWDEDRDMFGLLNEPEAHNSLNPADYARKRGRFYLIWNASKTSGRPMLIALMAGNAAFDVEQTDTPTLLNEVNARLSSVFHDRVVPAPLEVIVTRWKRDPFTRGTYSYVGPETDPGDYDLMAKPIGNLHFAGEATCGTHPATVHGAFLSGLRVAGEVMESMAGPLVLPEPLVSAPIVKDEKVAGSPGAAYRSAPKLASMSSTLLKSRVDSSRESINNLSDDSTIVVARKSVIKHEPGTSAPTPGYQWIPAPTKPRQSVCAGDDTFWAQANQESSDLNYETAIIGRILSEIGERPVKPGRAGVNPFLLYTKDKWEECKAICSSGSNIAGRDAIRRTLGVWWKAASDDAKQPYLRQSQNAQEEADAARKEWEQKVQAWDIDATRIRNEYTRDNPVPNAAERGNTAKGMMEGLGVSRRQTNTSNNVVLDLS
ncbi:Hypothetical protein R9X50_00547800 [Acrodontium crateriforme]|uniref:SWIRM domain-containing protein n=1 Tax=Acrodontium crateriforme TaxID=150365 RepID=A0AAQ3M7Q6_9PEZI|nr:Hypothetical protein R9X50_00547800 [Acrodontium crateriforme]